MRDPSSGVQAAITGFGFTNAEDAAVLYSLGGISESAVFILYRGPEEITSFAQFRGKRVSIGKPTTQLRSMLTEVLKASGGLDETVRLADLDYSESIEALLTNQVGIAVLPLELTDPELHRALSAPAIRLMSVGQAETVSKIIPGLRHVVLSRGLIDLSRDIPASPIDLLAIRNRLLVRHDLHPALQYLLLNAMREVHSPPGPFHDLGEFPREQPNDLPLSPTAEAYYRSGQAFWARYTSFWLTSLLSRIVFFALPLIAVLIPLAGVAPRVFRWLSLRRVHRLHADLADVEAGLQRPESSLSLDLDARLDEVEKAAHALHVARPFAADLHRLRIHLRMVREDLERARAAASDSSQVSHEK